MLWAGLCVEVGRAECRGQDRVLEVGGAGDCRQGCDLEMGVASQCGCGLAPGRSVACPGGQGMLLQLPVGQGQLGGGWDTHPALQAGTLVLPLHRRPLWLLQVLGPQWRALR